MGSIGVPKSSSGGAGGDVVGPASSTDNAAARFDGTTGELLQDSALIVDDVVAGSLTVHTTPGTALVVEPTEPPAAAGASVAGDPLTLNAGDAVASTDTDGAAAGGSVIIAAGAAARRNSGNANGGDINLTPGAGIGSGAAGVVLVAAGVFLRLGGGGKFFDAGGNLIDLRAIDGSEFLRFNLPGGGTESVRLGGSVPIQWSPGGPSGAFDAQLGRAAVGVLQINGTARDDRAGWYRWAGQSYAAADDTVNTTTLESAGLSVPLLAGRKYAFKLIFYLANTVAADGAKIDFNGGTATEANFRAQVTAFDAALALSTQVDDITDVAAITTLTGNGAIEVHGSFETTGAGTFIPRYAMNAATTGVLTRYRGSHLLVWDMP